MAKHTPGPWKWKGEDYRGDWGWQILVGPNGEGIIVGSDGGEPSKHLKAGCPARPELCITGIAAGDKPHVNAVHVYSPANAKLIAAAPDLLEACKNLLSYAEELEPNMEAELRDTHGTTSENYFIDIGKAKCAITKALG